MEEAVKIVLERRVRPGAHAQFEKWLRDLLAQAATFPGLQGSSVLSAEDDYFILLRFADHGELMRWQQSPDVLRLLAVATPLATAGDRPQLRTGMETWFTLPGRSASAAVIPMWKMALVTWLALLPQVIVLALLLPPMPFLLGAAVSTAIPVAMLTWVVMPRLTRLLQGWLYQPPAVSIARAQC